MIVDLGFLLDYHIVMKVLMDIKSESAPSKGDVIVWDGSEWSAMTKEKFLQSSTEKTKKVADDLQRLNDYVLKSLNALNSQVNDLAKAIGGSEND